LHFAFWIDDSWTDFFLEIFMGMLFICYSLNWKKKRHNPEGVNTGVGKPPQPRRGFQAKVFRRKTLA